MPNDSHDQLINIQEQLNLRYQLSPAHRLLGKDLLVHWQISPPASPDVILMMS